MVRAVQSDRVEGLPGFASCRNNGKSVESSFHDEDFLRVLLIARRHIKYSRFRSFGVHFPVAFINLIFIDRARYIVKIICRNDDSRGGVSSPGGVGFGIVTDTKIKSQVERDPALFL